jgi:hypothetical protein
MSSLRSARLHTPGQSHSYPPHKRLLIFYSFGVPAVLLELVPIAGIFFSFTNTVGAALWAADMEQHQQSGAGGSTTAPNLRNQAERARKEL